MKFALNPHDLEMPWFVLQDVLLDLHSTNKPSTPFARLPGNNSISFIDDVQISRYFWSLAFENGHKWKVMLYTLGLPVKNCDFPKLYRTFYERVVLLRGLATGDDFGTQ